MTRCSKCNVTISDNTNVCPLCQCVVSEDSPGVNAYPDVNLKKRKMQLAGNIVLTCVLVASAVLGVINACTYSGSWWCLIPVSLMVYGYMVFRMALVSRKGYRHRFLIPLLLTVIMTVYIDFETGFMGWSLNYVMPGCLLLVDLIIVMLMLTNIRNWYTYIIMEIGMTAVSAAALLLWAAGLVDRPLLSIIALTVSASMLVTAVVVGDRSARGELKRRFHIR